MSTPAGRDGPEAPGGNGVCDPLARRRRRARRRGDRPRGSGHGASGHERAHSELAARSRMIAAPQHRLAVLFTIVYASLASAIYFSLGVIAGHALGLTPLVFLSPRCCSRSPR